MTRSSTSRTPADPADVHLSDVMRLRTDRLLRRSRRTVREARVDSAQLVGTLRDLAEARARVVLRSTTGRSHRGVLIAVGADHVRIELDSGWLMVALSAIQGVQPVPGSRAVPATGDRGVTDTPPGPGPNAGPGVDAGAGCGAGPGAPAEAADRTATRSADTAELPGTPRAGPDVVDDAVDAVDRDAWTLADALDDLSYDGATIDLVPHGPGSAFRGELIGVGDDVVTVDAPYAAVYVPIASVAEVAWTETGEYGW
ncbi:MAG: hypothetical protein WDZ26_03860 [Nitriliruptoraceae bacterium]